MKYTTYHIPLTEFVKLIQYPVYSKFPVHDNELIKITTDVKQYNILIDNNKAFLYITHNKSTCDFTQIPLFYIDIYMIKFEGDLLVINNKLFDYNIYMLYRIYLQEQINPILTNIDIIRDNISKLKPISFK